MLENEARTSCVLSTCAVTQLVPVGVPSRTPPLPVFHNTINETGSLLLLAVFFSPNVLGIPRNVSSSTSLLSLLLHPQPPPLQLKLVWEGVRKHPVTQGRQVASAQQVFTQLEKTPQPWKEFTQNPPSPPSVNTNHFLPPK